MAPIHLKLSGFTGKFGKGASRFWGNPDLPQGCIWPGRTGEKGERYPYFFLCQINLEDIAPYDTGSLLPHKGLLSFFADIGDYLGYCSGNCCIGGTVSGRDAVKTMYFPDCGVLEERTPDAMADMPAIPQPLKISFSTYHTGHENDHALFAVPEHRPWEAWDHPFEDWEILLQVDSFEGPDFNLLFMDMGVLDFLISPSDLKIRRFDNVRAIVLSS